MQQSLLEKAGPSLVHAQKSKVFALFATERARRILYQSGKIMVALLTVGENASDTVRKILAHMAVWAGPVHGKSHCSSATMRAANFSGRNR